MALRLIFPSLSRVGMISLIMLIGMANPMLFCLSTDGGVDTHHLTRHITSGPPELPGLMLASVWRKIVVAELVQALHVLVRPAFGGDDARRHGVRQPEGVTDRDHPVATRRRSESPIGTCARPLALTRSTATSVGGSRPTTVASISFFRPKITRISLAPSITWLFVRMEAVRIEDPRAAEALSDHLRGARRGCGSPAECARRRPGDRCARCARSANVAGAAAAGIGSAGPAGAVGAGGASEIAGTGTAPEGSAEPEVPEPPPELVLAACRREQRQAERERGAPHLTLATST